MIRMDGRESPVIYAPQSGETPQRSISFVDCIYGTGGSIDLSTSGREAGDLCVLFTAGATAGTPPDDVTPSGFTPIDTTASGSGFGYGQRWSLFYKELDGTETTLSTIKGADNNDAVALIFRKSGGTWSTPRGVTNLAQFDGNFSATNVSIPASAATGPAVAIGGWAAFIYSSPNNYSNMNDAQTPMWQGVYFDGNTAGAGYTIFNTAPADMNMGLWQPNSIIGAAGFYFQLGA
ncbi:MAG: hypothetical protein JSR91_00155 [Proteobacteria bacterium]|nr:hypothetical protein [Pseudomonadota bacterium]